MDQNVADLVFPEKNSVPLGGRLRSGGAGRSAQQFAAEKELTPFQICRPACMTYKYDVILAKKKRTPAERNALYAFEVPRCSALVGTTFVACELPVTPHSLLD